jgi:hypothetical protein
MAYRRDVGERHQPAADPDRSVPAALEELGESYGGHWDKLGERPWPPSVTVERPADGYGLVGEPAQLFGATSRSEGVALRPVDASNIRAITRVMMGLDR